MITTVDGEWQVTHAVTDFLVFEDGSAVAAFVVRWSWSIHKLAGLSNSSALEGNAIVAEGRVELPGSYRPLAAGARRTGAANPNDEVEVTVTLRGPGLPGADDVTGPALDADAYAARYGASQADATKVKDELEKFGLQVYDVSLPAGACTHAVPLPS